MLKEVRRPDKKKVTFTYDALGRRLTKHFSRTTTHFLWSGNVPLHEWKETFEYNYNTGLYDLGTEHSPTTWIFEAGSFVPCGKIVNGKHYSIINDHLGTPIEAYNQEGELIWEREQDLYGNSRQGFAKENFRCPFKYQGQYYDSEVELCYNRFRYYHPETGRYISEDPIGFLSGEPNFFAYVSDSNAWVDLLGLDSENIYFDDFNQAMFGTKDKHGKKQKEGALDWLLKRGFKADIQNISRVKVIGEPHEMKTADGKVGFRIEFDEKVGAHINVFDKKEKDTPHFIFKASEKTVKKYKNVIGNK